MFEVSFIEFGALSQGLIFLKYLVILVCAHFYIGDSWLLWTHLLCWVRGAGVCCRGVVFTCSSSGNEDLLFFLVMTVHVRLQSAVLI